MSSLAGQVITAKVRIRSSVPGRCQLSQIAASAKGSPDFMPKPRPGDVLAIPARGGGYHIGVIITRNRFGTALGLFHGTAVEGRLDAGLRQAPRKYPIYTGTDPVADGTWKIIDHDDSLLALFPFGPPIYHRPDAEPDVNNGKFGGAETADGTLRLIGPDEAREVRLLDGTCQQVWLSPYLQKQLDVEADRP